MLTVTITNTLMSKTTTAGGGGGTSPVNTVAPVISGSGIISYPLSCADGTWTGTPVITYTYQWKRNGIDIVGETNSTYILDNADYGNAITCEVTGTNAFGFSSAVSNTITGTAIAPVNTVAPVIAGTNVVGSTLTTTKGTWTVDPSPLYTYQWYRGASPISGATSDNYTLVQADAAQSITCVVTATNVAGTASATSNALTIIDADAQAFLTAAVITNTTQVNAVNQLTVDLKSASIWTKMKAIYPFVGGTATTHKWNLKDPQDTDAAFRLVFAGGWTHSSTGALPNGTNGYADTFLNTDDVTATGLWAFGAYLRTLPTFAVSTLEYITGLRNGIYHINIINSAPTIARLRSGSLSDNTSIIGADGFIAQSRSSTTSWYGTRNSTNTTLSSSLSNLTAEIVHNFALSAYNNLGTISGYSTQQLAFAFYAEPLSTTEMSNFYTAVQAYQTTLSRQV